jgi:hypothetical protein
VITELMLHPLAAGQAPWIEVHNPGATTVDLEGWSLKDDATDAVTLAGASLKVQPGGYLVLTETIDGGAAGAWTTAQFHLAWDAADRVVLADAAGAEVDRVTWIANAEAPAPSGASIALRHPFLDNQSIAIPADPGNPASWAGASWSVATAPIAGGAGLGTPGAANADVWQEVEDAACDDSNLCTRNLCVAGMCANPWKDGCCLVVDDCDDGNPCTIDTCDADLNACGHKAKEGCCVAAKDCADENPCNTDTCSQDHECVHSAFGAPGCCWAPAKDPATGNDWVTPDAKKAFADAQCDDKDPCTVGDWCDLGSHACQPGAKKTPCCETEADCDDGDACTLDLCTTDDCLALPVPGCCNGDADCDDGDPCTADSCAGHACLHSFAAGAPNGLDCCATDQWCAQNADDGDACTVETCRPDPDPASPGYGRLACGHVRDPSCADELPFTDSLEAWATLAESGWRAKDLGVGAKSHWVLDRGPWVAGTPPDRAIAFRWDPSSALVKAELMSPALDASKCDPGEITVQWRHQYRHVPHGDPITLAAVASGDDFASSKPLHVPGTAIPWTKVVDGDLDHQLVTAEVPHDLWGSASLRIAFLVDTGLPPSSTFDMDRWRIDDVVVACGLPARVVDTTVFRCNPGATACSPSVHASEEGPHAAGPDPIPVFLDADAWAYVMACLKDDDATYSSWTYWGYPSVSLEGAPLDSPPFVAAAGCEANKIAIKYACGNNTDYTHYCGLSVRPTMHDAFVGPWDVALVAHDHTEGKGSPAPFDAQVRVRVEVLPVSGYVVWSPLGRYDPGATRIRDAIAATGRTAHVVEDLLALADLRRFDGVFATLGVRGRAHAVTPDEAAKLVAYLDAAPSGAFEGARLYVEGGDFWWTGLDAAQPATALHDRLGVLATSQGAGKLAGEVHGTGYLHGLVFGLSGSAFFDAFNDRIAHAPGQGGIDVLRPAGDGREAYAVAREDGAVRTIAVTFPFAGLVEQGGGTVVEAMSRHLDFLESGLQPCAAPSAADDCDDNDPCTTDSCVGASCTHAAVADCRTCADDCIDIDGSPSCLADEACSTQTGACVAIPGARFDPLPDACRLNFGGAEQPSSVSCGLAVTGSGPVYDVRAKVRIRHPYAGEVKVSLTGPSGVTAVLAAGDGASPADDVCRTFDVGVPSLGTPGPFNGQTKIGTWTLTVEDTESLVFAGVVESWAMYFSP